MDEAHIAALTDFANKSAWKKPDLNVLRSDLEGEYSHIAKVMQDNIRSSHDRGKLVLPDLAAFGNESVALFSDYSGESSGHYYTYSFLVCAWNCTGAFHEKMREIRQATKLNDKEIAFKDFRMGQMQRALPDYLAALDNLVNGFLFTIVIDKKLTTVFGPNERSTQDFIVKALRDHGLSEWKPDVAEKLVRIVHIGSFLVGLLTESGQKVLWMSDNDSVCANPELHRNAANLFQRTLGLYTDPGVSFPNFGYAVPFNEKSLEMLDLLSAADVVSSSVEHYLTAKDKSEDDDFGVKSGSDLVLRWLAHDGLALRKMTLIMRLAEGGQIQSATLEFKLKEPPPDVIYIPVIV